MQYFKSIESTSRLYGGQAVALGHALILSGLSAFIPQRIGHIVMAGDIAVDVFIIVSGFVHYEPYAREEGDVSPLTSCACASPRIYPIYVLCLAIGILDDQACTSRHIPEIPGQRMRICGSARIAAQSEYFSGRHLGLHLTLLHGMVPENIMPFAGTAFLAQPWSLSLEWQFYLVAPVLIGTAVRPPHRHAGHGSGGARGSCRLYQRQAGGAGSISRSLLLAIEYFILGILSRLTLEYRQVLKVPPELLLVKSSVFRQCSSTPALC